MNITKNTRPQQIADEYAHAMTPEIRKKLAFAISVYAEFRETKKEIQVCNTFDPDDKLRNIPVDKELKRFLESSVNVEENYMNGR